MNQNIKAVQSRGEPGSDGWYAEDDQHRRLLGPFRTEAECLASITQALSDGKMGIAAGAIGGGG